MLVSNIITYSFVFDKKINLLCLRHWFFPRKFMDFSEAATGGVLWKKLFLKILQFSQESCRPATLLKTHSNTGAFLWILRKFQEHLFQRTSAQWVAASVLTLLISSDNLLTGYEQVSVYPFKQNKNMLKNMTVLL